MTADQHVVPAEGGTWHWVPDGQRASQPAAQGTEAVQPRDPGFNGWSISQTLGLSPQQKVELAAAKAAVAAKAAADPSTLTRDDVDLLEVDDFMRLREDGQLAHVGHGKRKHAPRRGY